MPIGATRTPIKTHQRHVLKFEETMYPDQIEQSGDKPSSGLMGINFAVPSDSADAAKRRLLESGIESVHALKDFIVEYDRMKEERDQLKRQITDSLEELEMLRKQVQQLKIRRDQFSSTLSTLISQMETVVRKAQHFVDTHLSNGNRRWFPTLRNTKEEGQFQAAFKLISSTPATPADPVSTPREPDLAEATPATPADPSSIPLAPDAADSANAPETPADPSSPASDPADVMKKVLATWAEASSMPKAPDLAEPSTPAPSASKAE
jgi:FtsZ-binding cell division protein ZapB